MKRHFAIALLCLFVCLVSLTGFAQNPPTGDTYAASSTPPFAGMSGQRNIFRGDGYFSMDGSVTKQFRIVEGQTLKFQWDVFNTTNSVRFDPHSVQNNPFAGAQSFGVYSQQLVEARRMQLGLRYSF